MTPLSTLSPDSGFSHSFLQALSITPTPQDGLISCAWRQNLSAGAKLVLLAIATLTEEGDGQPSAVRLARLTGMTDCSVRRHLRMLADRGYIIRESSERQGRTKGGTFAGGKPPMWVRISPSALANDQGKGARNGR